MRQGSLILLFGVVVAVAAATGLGAEQTRAALPPIKPVVFTDTSGDGGSAADITTISVTNDNFGTYMFDIAFGTPYVDPDSATIFFDTDSNPATGSTASGSEYLLGEDRKDRSWFFEKWSGTQYADSTPPRAPDVRVTGNHLLVQLDRTDLDNTSSFNFYVNSRDGSGTFDDGHIDYAPDSTVYSYTFQRQLSLTLASAHAAAAKAGATWSYSMGVKRADTGQNVGSEGTIVCRATGAGKPLTVLSRTFNSPGGGVGPTATCRVHVPVKMKHKLVQGTITVTYSGLSITHTFAVRVG